MKVFIPQLIAIQGILDGLSDHIDVIYATKPNADKLSEEALNAALKIIVNIAQGE
jgi:hypothetical protein